METLVARDGLLLEVALGYRKVTQHTTDESTKVEKLPIAGI